MRPPSRWECRDWADGFARGWNACLEEVQRTLPHPFLERAPPALTTPPPAGSGEPAQPAGAEPPPSELDHPRLMDWMASAVELGTLRAWEVLGLGPPNREEARKRIAELELRAVGR